MEGETNLLLLVSALSLAVGTWLTGVWAALSELTWGKVRKLDAQKDKGRIARAEVWLRRRAATRSVLRLTSLVALAVAVAALTRLLLVLHQAQVGIHVHFLAAAAAAIVFVLVTDAIGAGLLAQLQWPLLNASMPVVNVLYWLLLPVNWPALFAQRKMSRILEEGDEEEKATTEDEIMSLVEKDAHDEEEHGSLEDIERQMIRGIFDLDETLVKEIMTPRVDLHTLPADTSPDAAKKMIVESGHTRIPVYDNTIDDIVGIVYSKDLLDAAKLAGEEHIGPLCHRPVFIPETKNVSVLLEEFKQNKIHIAVIIDEYGGTAGIVTIEDILEEIVGEIRDEFDSDEEELVCVREGEGRVRVDGRVPIDRINELLDLAIPEEEEYDTVAGYVAAELGRIPAPQETVRIGHVECLILEANERKISQLRLTRLSEEAADPAAKDA